MATLRSEGTTLRIETDRYTAAVETEGYVSGVARQSFVDRATGAHDLGFGLAVADFLLEPEWDDIWTDAQAGSHRYLRDPLLHGNLPRRYVELPQICTQAKRLPYQMITGPGFVGVRQWFQWTEATAGRTPGSRWEQTLVFPDGVRYFLAADRITSANDVECLLFRQDMPGHLRHHGGDTFTQVFLSTQGLIPAAAFLQDFPPDARYLYHRDVDPIPGRLIRAYQVRLPDGRPGPWLAGMTLDPTVVCEAWCHQRGYVCFIQEIGGFRIHRGETLAAAHVIGWFDDLEAMYAVCDQYRGALGIEVDASGYRLV
ncbi:MAG: hypothetical protein HY320_05495 [Armatimonadetes bacterium]|nr:hypothetical protein [Armatimonadota bacterium]